MVPDTVSEGFLHKIRPMRPEEKLPRGDTIALFVGFARQLEAQAAALAAGVQKCNITRYSEIQIKFTDHKDVLRDMLEAGATDMQIAEHLCVNVTRVTTHLIREGLREPPPPKPPKQPSSKRKHRRTRLDADEALTDA